MPGEIPGHKASRRLRYRRASYSGHLLGGVSAEQQLRPLRFWFTVVVQERDNRRARGADP